MSDTDDLGATRVADGRGDAVSGVLNIDKPAGLSSHDVVNRVRRITGQRRIGHTGTLDPAATGVLVLCLGLATRLAEYVTEARKVYRASVRLGTRTSTWDSEGDVVAKVDATHITLPEVESALAAFVGAIQQVPPMYSAVKRQGQPLYKLARRGLDVERQPRAVTVYELTVEDWRSPELVLRVSCSKGTYIRALAHDLGVALGVGAHLAALRRLAVGAFTVERAVSLDTLAAEADARAWEQYLQPSRDAVAHLPSVTVDEANVARLRLGQAVTLDAVPQLGLHCAYRSDGELVAVLRYQVDHDVWQPVKVLMTTSSTK